jgi:hypothetical protein
MNNYKITENKIYLEKDGLEVAYIDFSFTFERVEKVSFDKVFVDESLRSQGIAADIVKFGVDHFIEQDLIIVATCPYVDIWMKRHKKDYGKHMVAKQGGPVCSL